MPGNNKDINSNGRLIRNFVSKNGLRIVNGDAFRCKGLFTRMTANSVSALDLVLGDDLEDKLVPEMSIDTFGRIQGGSDHSAIFFKLKVNPGTTTGETQEEKPIIGPTQATSEAYREAFEALVVLADWNPMDTGEKCKFLQETLVGAAKIACNQKPQNIYTKLDTIGFGGKVKSLIQSMYYNDSVRVRITGGLTAPLWFTKGVKQGCGLSPLLFSLYMAGLGEKLHAMKEGVNFNGQVISALFFADDLVLISRTKVRGMERMLKEVSRFCIGMHMKLSIEKTIILSNGPQGQVWKVEPGTPDLEASLVGKYLGVDIQVKGRNLVKSREERMIGIAQKYAYTIMGITRAGLDRALVAHTLWEGCAIPAILYAVEAMILSNTVIEKLDSIQHQVARFILQLPSSAAKVAGYMEAGFKPMKDRIKERVALYVWEITHKKRDRILSNVFDAVIGARDDPWARMVGELIAELGADIFDGPKSRLKKRLTEVAIKGVLAQKRLLTSLICMPTPTVWFKLQPHVCDSKAGGLLNRLRAGDAGLGNRRPNIHGSTTKWCPLCLNDGLVNRLSEHHVVVSCQAVDYERSTSGLGALMTGKTRSSTAILTGILGGDNASNEVLLKRAGKLSLILDRWMFLAGPK